VELLITSSSMVEHVALNHKVLGPTPRRLAMKLEKARKRDKKRMKRNKMVVDSKSVFIIQQSIIKRSMLLSSNGKES
jgi:hypothetical protein